MGKLQTTITAIGLVLTAGMLTAAPGAELETSHEPALEAPAGVRRMIRTLQSCDTCATHLAVAANSRSGFGEISL